MRKHILIMSASVLLAACGQQYSVAIDGMASQTVSDIACKNQQLEEKLYDGLKSYLIEQKSIPTATELKAAMKTHVDQLAQDNPRMTSSQVAKLQDDLDSLVDSLLSEAPQGERVETPEQLLGLLSGIDVGDRSTTFRAYIQDRVRNDFNQLSVTVNSMDLSCSNTESASATPTNEDGSTSAAAAPTPQIEANPDYAYHRRQALAAGVPLAVFGERWALATAYQSCNSLEIPALDNTVPDIKGIAITGKHSDGVGNKRSIASLTQVQATHPYLNQVSTYGSGCFNVRQNPLIYDYGGKPYATTSKTSPIDLFKNSGDGTSVLGIDCSGYVYTSMATAGLRLKEGRSLKASDSWAWGSTSYVEPAKNGLTCLSKITVTPAMSLQAGDIVAVPGHVIIIDKVGADPFGIANAQAASDCSKLTSDGFDFTVAQSSPSKEGVGINHSLAKDYLPTSEKMQAGLQKYAYYACLAKFNAKNYTPSLGTLSVVRHKGTKACTDTRVVLSRESCIQSCSSSAFTQ
ncbi:hypothetical protein B9G69_014510 [Bdellovibrio sp. SKB1291214]|uniref:hypothetical protein n=1 Tax=Bdellovibrio sp. SKB1291214 TaxID=1732569 RepID=UPI0020CE904E|nr:hypothetical protein [Bdellovibrio sp. SKB1291214]UYL08258.1 hypothetical protein B9G69_014510 [Bdellovibrio sp. SKB1291214]